MPRASPGRGGLGAVSYLFVLRVSPDVDHMAPVMWKLLEEGGEVHAVVTGGYDAGSDYRIQFLCGYERFHLRVMGGVAGERRKAAYLLSDNIVAAAVYLVRHRVRVVATEWGGGPPAGIDRPLSRAWWRVVLGEAKRLVLMTGRPSPWLTRWDFMLAAKFLHRSLVCLPHGLNVKLDAITTKEGEVLLERPHPWHDRNRFDAYVLNTEEHRQWHLEHATGDPAVMQTWGSARWDPAWFERNRSIAPPFTWPEGEGDRLKVVLMAPKWEKRVDADAVVGLVEALQALDFVSLAVKQHPRPEDGSVEPLRNAPGIDWARIHDVSRVDSVPLIEVADVIVDVGSSIGIEVVMQGKVLLNPTYLHGITTFFDEIEGTAVVARNRAEVVEYLRAHARGDRHEVPAAAYDALVRRAVYGSRPEPFDVLDLYRRRLGELAQSSGRAGRSSATVLARS